MPVVGIPVEMVSDADRVLVVDRSVRVSAGAGATTPKLEVASEELDARFVDAYESMRPGEVLQLDLPRGRGDRLLGRDRVGTALFRAGFERTRFGRSDERQIVRAVRSDKQPPADRSVALDVVMPVYNERRSVAEVIEAVLAKKIEGVDIRLLIVESNSTDGTRELVRSFEDHPAVRMVLEERPQGKGHAVRAGLAVADGDFVLIQDADLEYDLDDYETVLAPLRALECSFVLGYRRRTNGARWGVRHFEKQVVVGRLMNVGNALFLALFNTVYRSRLRDPFTMYKVFRRDCLHRMRLECNRFDFDWELTAKLLRAGYRPVEVPVSYHSRSFSEGKKVSVLRDPLSWVVACFRYRFAPVFEERP